MGVSDMIGAGLTKKRDLDPPQKISDFQDPTTPSIIKCH